MAMKTSAINTPDSSDQDQLLYESIASFLSSAEKAKFDPALSKWPDDFYGPANHKHLRGDVSSRSLEKFKHLGLDEDILSYDSTAGSPLSKPEKNDKWLYPSQIRAWIDACDSLHGNHCQSHHQDQNLPLWLIDCKSACLVKATVAMPYVALSYVWGPTSSGVALKKNLLNLQKREALLDEATPLTIRNVIKILPLIGERYIWIDRLCIVQDDDNDSKARNINRMASIYSNARMTLVVAVGDNANHGLRGFHEVTPPLERLKLAEPDTALTAHQLTRIPAVTRTKWYSRGWTLQEIVFSRRTLFLTPSGAYWECHCRTWNEDSSPDQVTGWQSKCSKEKADIFRDSYLRAQSWPNLHLYLQLIAAYNSRDLTFDCDILPAFTGITTTLCPSFPGGFLFGIPEMFFDVALLWRPLGPSRRRVSTGYRQQSVTSSQQSAALPSWSWVGWQTNIDPLSWKCGYNYIKSTRIISWPGSNYNKALTASSSWEIKSTVQWHVFNPVRNTSRPVYNDFKCYQRSGEIPKGWSRYSLPFEESSDVEYVHQAHRETRFRFPIPLGEGIAPEQLTSEDYGYLLCCRTTRAYFRTIDLQQGRIVTSLLDENNEWVGVMRLHVEEVQFEPLESEDKLLELPKRALIEEKWHMEEFIEISEGTALNSAYEEGFLEEWAFEERPRDSEFYEFVNVLCISRHKDICNRKGIGRILRSAWRLQNPKRIEVILG